MGILPKNEPQQTIETPQNFFIYGETMSGKSYLAGEFPNPLFLDTDGNAKSNPYPSIEIRNPRDEHGHIPEEESAVYQLDQVVTELQTVKDHGYETLVLDVIDDIIVMIEQYICDKLGVETLADAGYGRGYGMAKSLVQQLVIDLKALPMNVIYISRYQSYTDENNVRVETPSLPEKYVNIINGNCDFMIQTSKIGKNYLRVVKRKRKNYDKRKVENQQIKKILSTVTGAFERTKSTPKNVQDEIVKEQEDNEEKQRRHTNDQPSQQQARRSKPKIN